MATLVLKDAYVYVNSVDLSDHARQVTLEYSADAVDKTAMGDMTHIRTGGLKDWRVTVEFYADEASSKVAQTLFSLVGSTTSIKIRPDKTAGLSATNPDYSGTAYVESFQPVGGSVGEMNMSPVVFSAAGTLSRTTT